MERKIGRIEIENRVTDIDIIIADNVKTLLETRNITQVEFAEKLNISKSMFNLLVNGNTKWYAYMLYDTAKILNVSMDELCYE